ERRDDAEPMTRKELTCRDLVVWQESGWAQLDLTETKTCRIGEHAIGRELVTPARHFADTPRDRRGGEFDVRTLASSPSEVAGGCMNVGVLGVGRLGASHAETLRSLPD